MTASLASPSSITYAGRRYDVAGPSLADAVARSAMTAYRSHAVLVPRTVTREVEHHSVWGNTRVEKVVETLPDTKDAVFADHGTQRRWLAADRGEVRRLLDALCRTAGVAEPAPLPEAPPGLVTDFALAEQPLPAVRARLAESLTRDREELALAFTTALHAMATGVRPVVGWVERSKADPAVCQFYFPRYGTDRRQEHVKGNWVITHTPFEEVHLHDLIAARTEPVGAGAVPAELAAVVAAVPEALREHVGVLSGRQILNRVLRRRDADQPWADSGATSVVRADAALVLGSYVLAGVPFNGGES